MWRGYVGISGTIQLWTPESSKFGFFPKKMIYFVFRVGYIHASPTTGWFSEGQCSFNRKKRPIKKILIFELRGWCQSYGSRSKSRFPLCNSLWFHKGNFIIMGSTPNFETTSWARKLIFFISVFFSCYRSIDPMGINRWLGWNAFSQREKFRIFFSTFLPNRVSRLVKLLLTCL